MDRSAPAPAAYAAVARRFARIGTLSDAGSVLAWDFGAVMPPGGAEARGEQLAVIAELAHELLVGSETDDLIGAAESAPALDGAEQRNLALMRERFRRARALPADLVAARARAETACEAAWRRARPANDFASVEPLLATVVALGRESADALAGATGLAPFDALMTGHQPGLDRRTAEALFEPYERFLPEVLPLIEARQAREGAPLPLPEPIDETTQEAVCRLLAARAGLDFDHARLDRSAHPFCGGTPDDVRITTRYDVGDPGRAIMGVLHETGHALYERGLPPVWRRQPIGEAAGMATHESQSLIVEMQACRSDAYLGWLGPLLAERFGGPAAPYAAANLRRLWRRVGRTLIRVDADEVTYPAHVVVRFRLEQALLDGTLPVADLPGAWSDGMAALLGVRPTDDRDGCLQDVHWFAGLFGYFPCYTVGAMAAAQLMAACRRAEPSLDEAFARGDLAPLASWLRREVHAHGHRDPLPVLIERATGAALGADAFLAHLRQRYLAP